MCQDTASPGALPRSSQARAGVAGKTQVGLWQNQCWWWMSPSKHLLILLHPSLFPAWSCTLSSRHPGVNRSPAPSSTAPGDKLFSAELTPRVALHGQAGSCPSSPHGVWLLVVPGHKPLVPLHETTTARRDPS